jgi:Icc-related predicted phosphoesterase
MKIFRRQARTSKEDDRGLTIFFATDIHGSEICFRKFLNAGRFYGAHVLVLGGDVTGKLVVPIVPRDHGCYVAQLGKQSVGVREDEKEAFERRMHDNGCYVYETEDESVLERGLSPEEVEAVFRKAMAKSFARWLEMAEDRLAGTGVRCFISPGNDDPWELDDVLSESTYVENPDGRVVPLDYDLEMLSLGTTNPTPWDSPREVSEEELSRQLEALAEQLAVPARTIVNLHCPPIDTDLDKAPRLDDQLRLKRAMDTTSVGSTAVRQLIERVQPLLGLHGHVHESRAIANIGRTVCINPGSQYGEGMLCGALVVVNAEGLSKYQLVSG